MKEIREPGQRTARPKPSPTFVVAAVFLAVVLAGGGFLVGRASVAPSPQASGHTSSTCDDATSAMQDHLDAAEEAAPNADTVPSDADKQKAELKQAAVVISQNPTCFSADERATAQTFLDNDEQQAAQSAARCAGAQSAVDRALYC